MKMFLAAIVLIAVVRCSNACSCAFPDPKFSFCHSALVIKGVVNNVEEIYREGGFSQFTGMPDDLKHNITVLEVFRKSDDLGSVKLGDTLSFFTAGSGSLCGIRLNTDTTYIITAYTSNGKLSFDMCSWLPRTSFLTPEQAYGIQGEYNCN